MYLLVGLGNPGQKYNKTRHNVGFQLLDYLAERHGLSFVTSKWQAEVIKASLWGDQIVLAKPQTFMNLSGLAVSRISSYYQIPAGNTIVVHDDLDLAPGRIKIVYGRGAGGHNGVKSIMEHYGGHEFTRIRVGIGRPEPLMESASYVLGRLTSEQMQLINDTFPLMEQGIELIITQGVRVAMNRINAHK